KEENYQKEKETKDNKDKDDLLLLNTPQLSQRNHPQSPSLTTTPQLSQKFLDVRSENEREKDLYYNQQQKPVKRNVPVTNPFKGWNGGPWGILHYLGKQLPDRFFSNLIPSFNYNIKPDINKNVNTNTSNNNNDIDIKRVQLRQNYAVTSGSANLPVPILRSPPFNGYFLAVTGAAFQIMYNQDQKEKEQIKQETVDIDIRKKANKTILRRPISLFEKINFLSCVFARMSPDDKAHLVESLMELGQMIGMCGDGANDCGALKTAHVGISLSEVEASIAAPFTSKEATVEAVEAVLLEGRAALASSFHAFKTTAVYSMVQFMSAGILIYYDSMLSDFAYLIIDILITLPILFTVSYSKSAKGLTRKTPLGSLISFPVISSLLMHVVVTFLYQLMSVVVLEHFCNDFVPLDMEDEDYDVHIQSYEQTTIFLASLCSYIVAGFVIHLHDKHLEVWYKNIAYDIGLVFTIVITILLIAQNITGLNDFLMTRPTRSPSFFIFLVVSIVVMTLLLLGLEYFV
ncbi:MAG: putative cation translocating P-type ATPase, partial [Streblomastix strix]